MNVLAVRSEVIEMACDAIGPPEWNDPHVQLVAFLAAVELLALASGNPAAVTAAGLASWIIRYLLMPWV